MERMRFLCIAPYENMSTVMKTVGKEFPVDLTVYVGDLEAGLEIALRDFHNDYDAVISRGGTAAMLRQKLTLPVVEIPVTMVEILKVMRLAGNMSQPFAIVGHSNITEQAKSIQNLFQIPVAAYSIDGEAEAKRQLERLGDGQYTLLCDMVAYRMAQEMNMNAILITSDTESVRSAFREALRICENCGRLQEENRFLRRLVWNQVHDTVVFTEDGELFFSTVPNSSAAILNYLREKNAEPQQQHYLKQINNVIYNIRMHDESFGGKQYKTYYFSESRAVVPDGNKGIRYLDYSEAEAKYRASFYSLANLTRGLQSQIQKISGSSQPLIVCGEEGTCKEQVVCYLYTTSVWRKNPLVIVDCFLLGDKGWNFLMDHHNSPLAKSDCTIFLQDVDLLPPQKQHQLIVCLLTMEVSKRNRLILSCICPPDEYISQDGMAFAEKLECLNLFLPPLRQRKQQMPDLVAFYLNHLNTKLDQQTLGTDDGALRLLQDYSWPHNYSQFKRVMHGLALACPNRCITEADTAQILSREKSMTAAGKQSPDHAQPLDLRQPLAQINKEIAKRVLDEENGNQTATAQRLGIGRTTLWRMLNQG